MIAPKSEGRIYDVLATDSVFVAPPSSVREPECTGTCEDRMTFFGDVRPDRLAILDARLAPDLRDDAVETEPISASSSAWAAFRSRRWTTMKTTMAVIVMTLSQAIIPKTSRRTL